MDTDALEGKEGFLEEDTFLTDAHTCECSTLSFLTHSKL